jgi:hypothetical protein
MHDDEGPRIAQAAGIAGREAVDEIDEPREGDSAVWRLWDSAAQGEEICAELLEQQPGLSEGELWRALAAYRRTGRVGSQRLPSAQLGSCNREKLRDRIRLLIGRLPAESLDEFAALVAFTETFLSRAQFVCELVVYLFAEREKGLEREGTEGRVYVEFFVQKLMWELDVVRRIAEEQPLTELNAEYLDWLTDRILDGEVLI